LYGRQHKKVFCLPFYEKITHKTHRISVPAVERKLIPQVVEVVESPYLATLRSTNTSHYGDSILKLLKHLSTTYGHRTPQQLKAKEMNICNMQFNMSHPVNIIFNAINDLLEMSEYALMPISSSQAVSLAYVVFARNLNKISRHGTAVQQNFAHGMLWRYIFEKLNVTNYRSQ